MIIEQESSRSRAAKWGWGILLAISALLVLNGASWFFMGGSLSTFEQDTGVSLAEFRQAYPTVANSIAVNARQMAIWFMAIGLLALTIAWQGFKYRSRWAWNTTWTLVGAPAAVGANMLAGGELTYGSMVVGLAVAALVGQVLAR
jgi:hypothetical protein